MCVTNDYGQGSVRRVDRGYRWRCRERGREKRLQCPWQDRRVIRIVPLGDGIFFKADVRSDAKHECPGLFE